MFWLLSLLMPNHRQGGGSHRFDDVSALLKSPETRGLLIKIVGILSAVALFWVIFVAVLSLLNVWLIFFAVLAMGGVVGYRQWQNQQQERRIAEGCCAMCGYDLRSTPIVCPECGRDAALDEPIWRRTRRHLEAKLLAAAAEAENQTPAAMVEVSDSAALPVVPLSLPTDVKLVTRRPAVDDTPIPLEGVEEFKYR